MDCKANTRNNLVIPFLKTNFALSGCFRSSEKRPVSTEAQVKHIDLHNEHSSEYRYLEQNNRNIVAVRNSQFLNVSSRS
jgi:hypothetical protein